MENRDSHEMSVFNNAHTLGCDIEWRGSRGIKPAVHGERVRMGSVRIAGGGGELVYATLSIFTERDNTYLGPWYTGYVGGTPAGGGLSFTEVANALFDHAVRYAKREMSGG